MSKVLELREKRAKAWEAAKAFLESKRGADGMMSAEDTASYDKMEADVVNLGKEIDRLERQAAIDAELNQPTSTPITNKPNGDPNGEEKTGRASDQYRNTFWNAMRRKHFYDVENALQVGTDSEGGYLTGGAAEGTTTSTANITFDDVMDLFYSVKSPYRKKAVWVLNDSTVKALRKLKDNNGNYIWQPSVQAGQPDMILNRPYHTSSYVPELAAGAKVMAFGDFSYYWIADRQGRSFKRLNELFAATGQVGFLASQRVDGKLILSEAVKTLKMKTASAG